MQEEPSVGTLAGLSLGMMVSACDSGELPSVSGLKKRPRRDTE